MSIKVEKFVTGPIETNTYVVSNDEQKCIVIDPSNGCEEVIQYITENNLAPEAICITHGHFDHVLGVNELLQKYPDTKIYVNELEEVLLRRADLNGSGMIGMNFSFQGPIEYFKEGPMQIGTFRCEVIVVPGHSPGGTALLLDKYLICGDILFAGSIGRSDLPGGDGVALVTGIKKKLMILPDETVVCPGHGGRTTIAREKRENPFL